MADTDKQNFRCDTKTLWTPFREHVEAMQAAGYKVDMSMILRAEVTRTINETPRETASRLGLEWKRPA